MEHAAMAAVAELIRTRTEIIEINVKTRYQAKGPCLLALLEESITAGSNSRSGGVPGSRPPIAIDAWDLWTAVQTSTRGWARHLGLDRSRYETAPAARARHGFVTPPVGRQPQCGEQGRWERCGAHRCGRGGAGDVRAGRVERGAGRGLVACKHIFHGVTFDPWATWQHDRSPRKLCGDDVGTWK